MEDIFQECLSRGFVRDMAGILHRRYVQQRDWPKARALQAQLPSTDRELPTIVEPALVREEIPAVYLISRDGETLTYEPADLAGPVIISVVSPDCHFSNDFLQLIEADPKLVRLFREHAVNIDQAACDLDTARLARANREGKFRYTVLHREADWKGFDFNSTPQLYFVKGGAIIHQLKGRELQAQELEQRLAEGMAAIGPEPVRRGRALR